MALAGNESQNLDHPWLLITDRAKKKEKQYLYSISDNRFHPVHIPEFHEMMVLGSAYGWNVIADQGPENENCFMWNPSTMDRIDVGTLIFADTYCTCVMSVSPSQPGYCHMLFYNKKYYGPNPCLLEDGETLVPPSYSTYAQYGDRDHPKLMAAAAFKGKIYVLKPTKWRRKPRRRKPKKRKPRNRKRKGKPRKRKPRKKKICPDARGLHFATFDFDGDNLKYSPIFRDDINGKYWYVPKPKQRAWEVHMIESPCGQELLLVQKIFMCPFVWEEPQMKVFRVDIDGMQCEELDDIGDRSIFLSNEGSCFCCSLASSKGLYRANCIYYTVPDKACRCVYVYDLDSRSTTPVLPCPAARRSGWVSNWIDKTIAKDLVCAGPALKRIRS